jgi:hypothetical protein
VRSKAARAHIAEGTRLFALAGRPTKAQFVKVYGPQGPKMTWAQRAKGGRRCEALPGCSSGERWVLNRQNNFEALSHATTGGLMR